MTKASKFVIYMIAIIVFSSIQAPGAIVWDNGMVTEGYMLSSQYDLSIPFESLMADDFMFEENTQVNEVRWYGGYFSGPPNDGNFDWRVIFYEDFGDGTRPGNEVASFYFSNANTNETFLTTYDAGASGIFYYYSYAVNLSSSVNFSAGEKYWVSFQGIGSIYPQSAISGHTVAQLHESSVKSAYFGVPEWSNSFDLFGAQLELTFELYGEPVACCVVPGDANHDSAVNILDMTYLINYLYLDGPQPSCLYEGDISGNCAINVLDITYLINYLYVGGDSPSCSSSCSGW